MSVVENLLTTVEKSKEERDDKSRERRRTQEDEDSRYSGRSLRNRKANRDDRETDPDSNSQTRQGGEHEPRLRIQERDDQRDESRRVRWRDRDRDNSSLEGSDSRTRRIYDGRDYRPKERRRKSRKAQDPGFADQMD